jgi:hypothetical protein
MTCGANAAMQLAGALELPCWLPPAVSNQAKQLAKSWAVAEQMSAGQPMSGVGPKMVPVILRLATDDRMRQVWGLCRPTGELLRRRRDGGTYLHPACGPPELTNEERQMAALAQLFDEGITLLRLALPAMTRHEVEQDCERTAEVVAALRKPAMILKSLESSEGDRAAAAKLAMLADDFERGAQLWRQLPFPIRERRRGDAELQGYLIALSRAVRQLFNKPLQKTTLTIARVITVHDDISLEWLS